MHLLMDQYLDGKPVESEYGAKRVAPQSYISTAANILTNIFAFTLNASLAIAFTQYLWYILRQSALKVSTVELLFCVRSNPFHLLNYTVAKASPVLFAIVVLLWGITTAKSFPPGALTVTSASHIWYQVMNVSTFNSSFVSSFSLAIIHCLLTRNQMGNGSGYDANRYSLDKFVLVPDETTGPSKVDRLGITPLYCTDFLTNRFLINSLIYPTST